MSRQYLNRAKSGYRGINALLAILTPATAAAAPVNAVAATGVLTMATKPTANDTVTIGSRVYKFVASAAATGDVAIGANVAASQANLVTAIGGDAHNLINTDVTAAAFSSNAMTVTAIVKGTLANAVATTSSLVAGAPDGWGAATLASGIDASLGQPWEQRWYSGALYINTSDTPNKVSDTTWYSQTFTHI
jgi:hypothetical protein